MGKKQMAKRTPTKKSSEGKRKYEVQKGKEKLKTKVAFADPVMETEESEANDGSDDISEVTGEEDRETSGEEDKQEPESEDDGLERALEQVVKIAAAVGEKKKNKKQAPTVDEIEVNPEPLKVDRKKATVGQSSKEVEVEPLVVL
ncbi:uncharacterized protein LOC141614863 [Silene latifolia]|uniref:uncharacterized protein LOC141614863 n=1 Tax=Silene latifolia TaxID=37657 RepID=UPI003D78A03F